MSRYKQFFIVVAFLMGATIVLKYSKTPKTLKLINRVLTIILATWIIARTLNS